MKHSILIGLFVVGTLAISSAQAKKSWNSIGANALTVNGITINSLSQRVKSDGSQINLLELGKLPLIQPENAN